MSTLLDALKNGGFGINSKTASELDNSFANKIPAYRDSVVNEFFRYNTDLNVSIAKIAARENLNDDQIQRIIEEVNNQVYLIKYNQMKNSPERDVAFDLAMLPKIKENYKFPKQSNEVSNSEGGTLQKTASWEDESGDKRNFLNYTLYDTVGLSIPMQSKSEIEKKASAKEIQRLDDEYKDSLAKSASEFYDVADTLIKYDRHNLDAQDIFSNICKEAELRKLEQIIVKDALEQKIAQMKEYKIVPDEYDFKIELVDIDKVANEFSLGNISFLKEAKVTQSNSSVPTIVTDNGKIVKNVKDLAEIAKRAKKHQKDAKSKYREKVRIETSNK